MWACGDGHIDVARFLLEHDADPNAETGGGWTPLHYAARNGRSEAIKFLIQQNGIELNKAAHSGGGSFTPVEMAISNGSLETVKALVNAGCWVGQNTMPDLPTR
jgi:cytohesin